MCIPTTVLRVFLDSPVISFFLHMGSFFHIDRGQLTYMLIVLSRISHYPSRKRTSLLSDLMALLAVWWLHHLFPVHLWRSSPSLLRAPFPKSPVTWTFSFQALRHQGRLSTLPHSTLLHSHPVLLINPLVYGKVLLCDRTLEIALDKLGNKSVYFQRIREGHRKAWCGVHPCLEVPVWKPISRMK